MIVMVYNRPVSILSLYIAINKNNVLKVLCVTYIILLCYEIYLLVLLHVT